MPVPLAAPGNTPPVGWTGKEKPLREDKSAQASICTGTVTLCSVYVCVRVCVACVWCVWCVSVNACVVKNVSSDEKHTKWFSVPQKL